jgi:lysophospholipid acyltransferase (LPLAT)-like uncharacterized protein
MREIFLSSLAVFLIRLLFLTVRLKISDGAGMQQGSLKEPVILVFWHNRILGISAAFLKRYPKGRGGVTVLTSPSRDGEILSRIMAGLGMGSVRGSSSRRGARALLELIRLIKSGRDIAITPDGPRGPRYHLGPGAIQLAQNTRAPLLPVHASFSNAVRMKTWDGFIIPLPFSKISVTVDKEIHLPENLTPDEFESWRQKLEKQLTDAAD